MNPEKDAISVKIGIFSGRPNPEFSVKGKLIQKLVNMLETTLGKESIHPPPLPRLGDFYGFMVNIPENTAKKFDIPNQFKIYHGVITEIKPKKPKYWRDIKRIEQFLLSLAYEEGYGELLVDFGIEKPKEY